MLKELFSNRLFIGALAFFILCVVGGTLYISHVEKQGLKELTTDEDRVKQLTEEPQPTAEAPVVEQPEQGGHFHEDGTWHGEPHKTPPRLRKSIRPNPHRFLIFPHRKRMTIQARAIRTRGSMFLLISMTLKPRKPR